MATPTPTKKDLLKQASKKNIRDQNAKQSVTRGAIADAIDAAYDYTDEQVEALRQEGGGKAPVGLATVATTGKYSDLQGLPTIPAAYTNTMAQALIDQAMSPILALIGSAGGDADAFVNTVRETLAVMANFPEGVNLLLRLAAIDERIDKLRVPLDFDPENPAGSYFAETSQGLTTLNLVTITTAMLGNAQTLQLLRDALGSAGMGSVGVVGGAPAYPSLAGAKSYIISFENAQTPFKERRDFTYGTNAFGVYYQGVNTAWDGGGNTGLLKEKIPAGVASSIAWDLKADGAGGNDNNGVGVSDNLTRYFDGFGQKPVTLGVKNGFISWSINGVITVSTIATPAAGDKTSLVMDVPATGNITGRYTTDGTTWTPIAGFSAARPAVDLAPVMFIDGPNRIYNFRATNLQPF